MHVTTQAKTELHEMLQRALADQPQAGGNGHAMSFRLLPSAGEDSGPGLGLTLDAPKQTDEIVEHQGRSVLVLDTATSAMLDGLTLDLVDTPEGVRLGLLE